MARLPLILTLVVLAGCQLAAGQKTTFDGKATASALADFVADLRSSVQSDLATWGSRLEGLRSRYIDRSAETRASLSSASPQGALSTGWELILDAGGAIKRVLDAKALSVRDFLSDVLGHNWSAFASPSWLRDALSWDNLADFEITSNLQDVLSIDAIRNYQRPETIGQLYSQLENVVDSYCDLPDVTHPAKVPTTCTGPQIRIAYVPKSCALEAATKKIVCDPAKLVLHKTPGQCTLKHLTPFIWTGKQCRHKVQFGHPAEKLIGGGQYTVDFTDHLSSAFEAIRQHVILDAPFSVTTAAIVGEPLQRTVTWIAAEKAHLQGILKYQITCFGTADAHTRTLKVHYGERSAVIGVDATGDNRALAPGVAYTCSVAGINIKGNGAAKDAVAFTTPEEVQQGAGLPLTTGADDVGESPGPGPIDVWRPDRRAPAVFNPGPLTYQGRTNVIQIGVVSTDLQATSYYNTQGRVLAIASNIQPGDIYGVTGDLFIPALWRDSVNPANSATWRRAAIWSQLLNPNNYLAPNQGYATISGFHNVPITGSTLPVDAFTNPQQFSRFFDWNPTGGYSILPNIPVRYNDWNTITSEVSLSASGVYTFKNYFNGVLADTFTETQAGLADGGDCSPSGTGCTQLHMYLQVVNPCSGFSTINAAFCDKTASGGVNSCCKGATYDAYWSNVRAWASSGAV